MRYLDNTKKALREVYKKKRYLVITLIVTFVIIVFNLLVNNYKIIFSNFTPKLVFSLFIGGFYNIETLPLIFLVITSISAGILLSMAVYIIRRQISGSVGMGSSSIAMSVIAPACPSCAIGLVSTLGFGSFFAFLPFRGLELGVFAVIIIAVSIVYMSGKIVTKTCAIKVEGG